MSLSLYFCFYSSLSMSLIRLLPHRSEHSKDLWRCHCSSSSSGNLFGSPPNSPSGPEDWAEHQQSWNLRVSFLLCEVVVAYLQNLLMMFPLISDHPLRERTQLVECNLKHIAIEDNDQSLDTLNFGQRIRHRFVFL